MTERTHLDKAQVTEPGSGPEFEALLDYVKRSRGFDFTAYKRSTLLRRVAKRMSMVGIRDYSTYVDYLETEPAEFTQLFNTILINVTAFFRDPATWEYVREEIIPRIIENKAPAETIRVWSAGCATGQEAYTVAMLLAEALGEDAFRARVKIYGTDVDEEALNLARQACYGETQVEDVPPPLLQKYFEKAPASYTFRKELRRSIIFGRHDLIQDAPISRVDLLICRNTLMYFNAEAQARVLTRFRFALNNSGFLFLGKSEMLLTYTNLFRPVDLKRRVFTAVGRPNLRERLTMMAESGSDDASTQGPNQVTIRETALDRAPVATLLVDPYGVLVHANEKARAVFTITFADIGRPLQDLEVSYRPVELRSLIDQSYSTLRPAVVRQVEWRVPGAGIHYFDLQVTPLVPASGKTLGASISFQEVTRIVELQNEVVRTKEELETYTEELQSTNEELETMNEEMQSTNEELETTNEELQSTNEELETLNNELGQRTGELDKANAFLESILSSFGDAVIVLDRDLRVQLWNQAAEDQWGLRPDEARGEHFANLDIGLRVEQLLTPLRQCLDHRPVTEAIVLDGTNRRGRPVQTASTCTPLVSSDKHVRGVIMVVKVLSEGKPAEPAGGPTGAARA